MKQFYVIGNPIKHSKSPTIHQNFAKQCQLPINYQTLEVSCEGEKPFNDTITRLQSEGVTGCNITLPFKEHAFRIATKHSESALFAGASNTLHFYQGEIYADNTDGVGLVYDITQHLNTLIKDANILIIGAGGAVRGVLSPILNEKPGSLTIINRSEEKAHGLAALCRQYAPSLNIQSGQLNDADTLKLSSYDIIINGASTSVNGGLPDVPDSIFHQCQLAYDMMYSNELTPFEQWALDKGAIRSSDGLGMLVEQAAQAFLLWNQYKPNTNNILKELRGDKYTL